MKTFLLLFFLPIVVVAQEVTISGRVEDRHPVEYAAVQVKETGAVTYTDRNGNFSLKIDFRRYPSVQVQFSHVGRITVQRTLTEADVRTPLRIALPELSLTLSEVQVTSNRESSENSNSSVVFGRQAIEQSQAFSLTDILNNLPGKALGTPNLQAPQTITLRSEANGEGALNNALGTAIIVDGLNQSNNANLQNMNLGKYGMSNASLSSNVYATSFDVPFTGTDLRQIPADQIESIEVVSGVASARYGDLTDGAIILNRQAGVTPVQFATRINGASTNLSLSKGFDLGKKRGTLNAGINYLFSNEDPRDRLKSYYRVSGDVLWTVLVGSRFKNTVSASYSEKFDNARRDPDDDSERSVYSRYRRFSVTNRTSLSFNHSVLKSIRLNVGYDAGFQETYSQWWLNGNPKGMANKDTTGVYEGYFIPGSYLATELVRGRPANLNGTLDILQVIPTGAINHALTIGANTYWSANTGSGIIVDPDRPRFPNTGYKNDRPYNYDLLPDLFNYGFYAEDRFAARLLGKVLSVNAGVRFDVQNGWGTLQPRINLRYSVAKDLQLSLAYGTATKAPTLGQRYPGPVYFDLPVLNVYTGRANESLYLVYTYKYTPDNSSLKPSRSDQLEVGLSWKKKAITTSVFFYYKQNRDGFNSETSLLPIAVPVYTYALRPGQKPSYENTGKEVYQMGTSYSRMSNSVSSDNAGIEWYLSTRKIPAIQTSFTLNTAFSYTEYRNSARSIVAVSNSAYLLAGGKVWYGVYTSPESYSTRFTSKLTSDTHISRLGLVFSLYADLFWRQTRMGFSGKQAPSALIDNTYQEYPVENFVPNTEAFGYLGLQGYNTSDRKTPFYSTLSMRISKEITRQIRFSVNAYNLLKSRSEVYSPYNNTYSVATIPASMGAELSIKF